MTAPTTPDSTDQTWRSFAGRLPDYLVAEYEREETKAEDDEFLRRVFPHMDPAETRHQIQHRLFDEAKVQARFYDIPLPAEATTADSWIEDDEYRWTRIVYGTHRTLNAPITEPGLLHKSASLEVGISGMQTTDGRVEWSLYINSDENPVGADSAVAFASLMIEAADELSRLRA